MSDVGQHVWASGTYDPGSVLQAQADGNVVIYGPGHVAVWATSTDQPGSVLVVQDDGNIVVYAPGAHRGLGDRHERSRGVAASTTRLAR